MHGAFFMQILRTDNSPFFITQRGEKMGNTNIELFTDDQRLYFAKKTFIASGDVNSVQLAVKFDESWANYPVRNGYFRYTGFGMPTIERERSIGTYNTCKIPHDVLENPGTLEIGVTGTSADGTQQKSSGLIKYRLHPGAKRPGITMSPTIDLFQQLVASVKEMNDPVTKAAMQYVAEQCQVEFERLQNEVEEVKNTVNGVVLWENADTASAFDAQTIAVDLSGYKRFTIVFVTPSTNLAYWTQENQSMGEGDVPAYKEYHFAELNVWHEVARHDYGDGAARVFKPTATGIQFSKAYASKTFDVVRNGHLIPFKIKGYK